MTRIAFASWIPTVSGRLSFSVIGQTAHPTRAVCANVGEGGDRVIVAYQKRYLADALRPFRWFLRGIDGTMWFVCVAETGPQGKRPHEKLVGRLFIFHNRERWLKVKNEVRAAQDFLKGHAYQDKPLKRYTDHAVQTLRDTLMDEASLCVRFSLRRTGETFILFDEADQRWSGRPNLSGAQDQRDPFHEAVSQTFYFLRDLAHTHQHHDPYTDTIVDLYRLSRRPRAGRNKWRDSVLFTLYGKIIHFKKAQSLRLYHSSAGVLAYARAFTKISAGKHGTCTHAEFYDETIAASISTGISLLQATQPAVREWQRDILTYTITVFALVVAIAGLQQLGAAGPPEDKPVIADFYRGFTAMVLGNPLLVLLTVLVFTVAPIVVLRVPFLRRGVRAALSVMRRIAVGASPVAGAVFFGILGISSLFLLSMGLAIYFMP